MSNDHPNDPGHGDSVAAWTASIVIMLAVALGTLFTWTGWTEGIWLAGGLIVVGIVIGPVLSKLGFGIKR